MHNAFLIGTDIYLRAMERGDAPAFASYLNDPEVRRFLLLRPRPITLAEEEAYIAHITQSEHDVSLAIVLRQDNRLIGATSLHQIDFGNRHCSFGIMIGDPSEWGKGHGTEATRLIVGHAFETLNLNRVWLHVYEYNPRGIRAYEKVGFRREGVLRQDSYRDGRYWDTIVMGILRDEWEALRRAARQKDPAS
jgi:RimJ/RimL family protein N-acetyltransferase